MFILTGDLFISICHFVNYSGSAPLFLVSRFQMRILMVCGRRAEAERLAKGLRDHRFTVDLVHGEAEADALLGTEHYDAIVVEHDDGDLVDAVRVTRRLRGKNVGEPLLVMAAHPDESVVIEAMNAGADQVMDSERSFEEFIARVRGLLRHCGASVADRLTYRDIIMDLPRLVATRETRPMMLVGKPYALLEFFVRSPDKVHSREAIGASVWDRNFDPFSNVIDVTVSKLRQELDKPYELHYLHTVVGSGYMMSDLPPGHPNRR